MSDWKELLKQAKELFEEGLLDEDEFKAEKSRIMKLRAQSTTIPPSSVSDTFTGGQTTFGESKGNSQDTFMGGQTQFQVGGQTIGHYQILGEIGKGGMGMVYRARHQEEAFAQQTGDVVIKLMHPQYAQDSIFKQRFISEAAMGRNIQHPNIVRIHDVIVDKDKEILGIVMDFVEGESLDSIIPKNGMDLEEAMPIIEQLCRAIDHIHEKGIIHRDLKPENIIISSEGKVTILDMGIAKDFNQADLSQTSTGVAMGTPLYMAPEQLNAKNTTSAADRYAFGLIVYQMISGELPWNGSEEVSDILTRKLTGNLKVVSSIPEYIRPIVMGLLGTSVKERWVSCSDFLFKFKEERKEHFEVEALREKKEQEEILYRKIQEEKKHQVKESEFDKEERLKFLKQEEETRKDDDQSKNFERYPLNEEIIDDSKKSNLMRILIFCAAGILFGGYWYWEDWMEVKDREVKIEIVNEINRMASEARRIGLESPYVTIEDDLSDLEKILKELTRSIDDRRKDGVAIGKYHVRHCTGCHSLDGSRSSGPTFKGMYGSESETDKGIYEVTDSFIYESIRIPAAKIAKDFSNGMIPYGEDALSDKEISYIIEYIKTLK